MARASASPQRRRGAPRARVPRQRRGRQRRAPTRACSVRARGQRAACELIERHVSAAARGSFVQQRRAGRARARRAAAGTTALQERRARTTAFDTLSAHAGAGCRATGCTCSAWAARPRAPPLARAPGGRARRAGARGGRRRGARQQVQDAVRPGRARRAAHTRSEQMFRGIAAARARVGFNGQIVVARRRAPARLAAVAARACWPAPRPRSTCARSWRSTPTRCAAATAPPPASSTTHMLFYLLSRGLEPRDRAAPAEVGVPRGCWSRSIDVPALRRQVERSLAGALRGRRRLEELLSWPPTRERTPHRLRCRARARATSRSSARTVNGHPLVYLDSAASSQRPRAVIAPSSDYETHSHANVHRGVHTLSQEATGRLSRARASACAASSMPRSTREIVFVRGTTEAINLVAQSCGRPRFRPGDEILITALEHHANIVPWQMAARARPAHACASRRSTAAASSISTAFQQLLSPRTRLVRSRMSPTRSARSCRCSASSRPRTRAASPVLVDGAQAVPHIRGRRAGARLRLLRLLRPQDVRTDRHRRAVRPRGAARSHAALAGRRRHDPARCPSRAPPTTSCRTSSRPARRNIAGAVGLAAAIDYLEALGIEAHRRPRAAPARARHRGSCARIPGLTPDRHGGGQGLGAVLHDGGRPPARPRHHPRHARASPCAPAITARCR